MDQRKTSTKTKRGHKFRVSVLEHFTCQPDTKLTKADLKAHQLVAKSIQDNSKVKLASPEHLHSTHRVRRTKTS